MKYLGLSLLSLQGALSWSLWSYVKQAEYERLGLPVMTTPSPRKDTTTSKFNYIDVHTHSFFFDTSLLHLHSLAYMPYF